MVRKALKVRRETLDPQVRLVRRGPLDQRVLTESMVWTALRVPQVQKDRREIPAQQERPEPLEQRVQQARTA
jgi:hypothetical protein